MKTILVDTINTFLIKDQGIFKEMYDLLENFENIVQFGELLCSSGILYFSLQPFYQFAKLI